MAVVARETVNTGMNVKKPEKLDTHKAGQVVKRVIRENTEWLQEMAKK